jgi:hypothetical protein
MMKINLLNNLLSNNLRIIENLLQLTSINYTTNSVAISSISKTSNFITIDSQITINQQKTQTVNIKQ